METGGKNRSSAALNSTGRLSRRDVPTKLYRDNPGAVRTMLMISAGFYLYPAVSLFRASSHTPMFLGRFSAALLILEILNLSALGFLTGSILRPRRLPTLAALFFMATVCLGVGGNSFVMEQPWMIVLLPLVRLVIGVSIILTPFFHRGGLRAATGLVVLMGTVLLLLSIFDSSVLILRLLREGSPERVAPLHTLLRPDHDRAAMDPRDIVIVGDSFIWGAGVEVDERIGNQLERILRGRGEPTKVYSLGIGGQDISGYIHAMGLLPDGGAARVVVSFYHNDMPQAETLSTMAAAAIGSLGRTSPFLGLLNDTLNRLLFRTVEDVHRSMIRNYDPAHPTFSRRWDELIHLLAASREIAGKKSSGKPLLMILPVAMSFDPYPLAKAHERISAAASEQGFDVIDMLDPLRDFVTDGRDLRLSPNDLHYNPGAYAVVARVLADTLR